ncbi:MULTISPECIES: helix-turn-helix transcriptional regulator [unclassified Streptomyces]|uniref:helix-turn-helix transcriptional regulator n=1 Tax=unclassified Streptomyces TaxID=2593676 RepID=UPI002E21690C
MTDPAIAAALNHIHRHTAYPWTVQELAHRVGMSRTVFARRFTHLVGQAPMAYVPWWRLSTAARILRGGDDPLAAVAQQVGYTSEFAFANAFKRAFGVAPGRFRRAQHAPRLVQ